MMGYVLAVVGMNEDKHVTFLPSYGGGNARRNRKLHSGRFGPGNSISHCVLPRSCRGRLNYLLMLKYQNMIASGGTLFLNSDLITEQSSWTDIKIVQVPANSLAHEMGDDRVLNMVMLEQSLRLGGVPVVITIRSPFFTSLCSKA